MLVSNPPFIASMNPFLPQPVSPGDRNIEMFKMAAMKTIHHVFLASSSNNMATMSLKIQVQRRHNQSLGVIINGDKQWNAEYLG